MSGVGQLTADSFAIAGVRTPQVGTRYGMKGPRAAEWLVQQGIAVPPSPNSVVQWSGAGGGRCLRLGSTEFLVEYDGGFSPPSPTAGDGAWLLLRGDASLLLDGAPWPTALAQACSFDFQRLHQEPAMVVMTLLAGIGVTMVREPHPDASRLALRLWCDATYSSYLQSTLHSLVRPA